MLCRDEAVNLIANLPLWLPFIDKFVFVIDDRSTDNSVEVIEHALGKAKKEYRLISNNFTGFGAARTLGLTAAWESFPTSTHVMISDPDWVPIVHTINLNELDDHADVFRFTMFDAQRDGNNNKRAMDWIVRNRPGNAMKYHLHEVLSIGKYSVKLIGWQVREVEKQGTWHATVGHTSSTSANRFQFDLNLLYKDLDMYGHEPHVDYYLAITHQGYAMKAVSDLGASYEDVVESIEQAIHYFTLRATSAYSEEFLEQRWGSMIELGNIFTSLKRNDIKAIYWFNMCRDLDPKQPDCSMLLCQLYIRLGQLQPALQAMKDMLSTERGGERLSQLLDIWDCDIPSLAVDLLRTKATAQGVSSEEAMYFFVLLDMMKKPSCAKRHSVVFNREVRATINSAVGAATGTPVRDYFETPNSFCSSPLLHRYLTKMGYTVHPCEEFRASRQHSGECDIFLYTSPPANEEFQLGSFSRKFIGAAIIPDIVHHAYQGNSPPFLEKNRPLRFLFAEYFTPEMIFNAFGQLDRHPSVKTFEIVIVSPDENILEKVIRRFAYCRSSTHVKDAFKIKRVHQSLLSYASSGNAGKFDYIEYNGGLSRSTEPEDELRAVVKHLLHDDGVVGLTYFARNFHTEQVHELVSRQNATKWMPFSSDPARLVRNYFNQYRLEFLLKDTELIDHLTSDGGGSSRSVVFSQHEVEAMISKAGLRIASWIPTAYARPFEEMRHYSVLKYQAMGISQERFVEDFMANFRYTTYLVKSRYQPSGRVKLSKAIFQPLNHSVPEVAAGLVVYDRLSNLMNSFAAMEQLALRQQSTTIEFAHYALPGDTHFAFILSPLIAPCLPHLSAHPSVLVLHEINRNFALKNQIPFDEGEAQDLLLSTLAYLERLNLITFEYSRDVAHASANTRRAATVQTMADRRREFTGRQQKNAFPGSDDSKPDSSNSRPSSAESFEQPMKVGGLNVRSMAKKTSSVTSSFTSTGNPASITEVGGIISSARKESHFSSKASSSSSRVEQRSVPEGPSGSSASISAGGLTQEVEIMRMRGLGYSDEAIEQLLGVDLEEFASDLTDQADKIKTAGTAGRGDKTVVLDDAEITQSGTLYEPSTLKARGIIDLLKRFTQQRASDATKQTAVDEETTADIASSELEGNIYSDEAVELSEKTSPSTSTRNSKSNSDSSSNTVTLDLTPKRPAGGLDNVIMAGGLKLPAHRQLNSHNAAIDHTEKVFKKGSTSFAQLNKERKQKTKQPVKEQSDVFNQHNIAAGRIKMPTLSSVNALLESPRGVSCIDKRAKKGTQPGHSYCQEPKAPKRKTAQLTSTSTRKVAFDIAQIDFILSQNKVDLPQSTVDVLSEARSGLEVVMTFLQDNKLEGPYRLVRLSPNIAIYNQALHLNRALHIGNDPNIPADKLVHQGAMKYLNSLRREVDQHDYLVVDVILQDNAMKQLSKLLLSSTVWFDVTNAAAFVSHHDDGLVFPSLHTLVQQVALALSEKDTSLTVKSYYTVAMDLRSSAYSPVFMANKEDFLAVLWLSPQTASAESDGDVIDHARGSDGLRIYSEASASRLFSQGVSVYPSAHSDFLSRSSNLAIDLSTRCSESTSEFVPRSPNRLVVVRSNKLCTLLAPGIDSPPQAGASFEQSTVITLVMVLSPS